ncbi:uncharacterized protein LOC123512451 [Portunus trituberculatus]|uniref:uncharacterized protein LOC123512451 n=1 Tax=Portunus trituberculatus TaxID=210409 RepID=UPI001E1CF717|nr:uncharacterized protein LOC123512451 [Portunus trituberculatus]
MRSCASNVIFFSQDQFLIIHLVHSIDQFINLPVASSPLSRKDVIIITLCVYMSCSPYKRKSEVIWSEHAYSVATEGGLGPFCQPETTQKKTENKCPCLSLVVHPATKPAASHVGPAQRTMLVAGTVEVELAIAALEDMEIVEEPRPAPSGKEKHQKNAAADQIPCLDVPAPAISDCSSLLSMERQPVSFSAGLLPC